MISAFKRPSLCGRLLRTARPALQLISDVHIALAAVFCTRPPPLSLRPPLYAYFLAFLALGSTSFSQVEQIQIYDSTKMSTSAAPTPATATDPNYKPPPGRVGNLTAEQQAALDRLKKELQEAGKFVPERMDDPTLLR